MSAVTECIEHCSENNRPTHKELKKCCLLPNMLHGSIVNFETPEMKNRGDAFRACDSNASFLKRNPIYNGISANPSS